MVEAEECPVIHVWIHLFHEMFKGCVNAKGKFAIHSKIKTNLSATAVESRKIEKEDFYWSSQISGSQKTKYGSLLMKFEIPLGVSDLSGNLNILRLQKCKGRAWPQSTDNTINEEEVEADLQSLT